MALRDELRTQGDWLFRYRSFLPLVIVAVGFVAFVYAFRQNPVVAGYSSGWRNLMWLVVGLFGFGVRVHAVGYAAPHTSGRNTVGGQIANEVNTTGLYSLVRHPLYVGNFLMWLAAAGFTHNPWFVLAFIFFFIAYYERIIYAEEAYLLHHYGAAYRDWAAVTPAVVPSVSRWRKPVHRFDWRRVLKREKSGLAYLMSIGFAFHWLSSYLGGFSVFERGEHWLVLLLGAWLVSLVIKVVQRRTDWLKETALQGAV